MIFIYNTFIGFASFVAGIFGFYALAVKSLRDDKARSRWGEFNRQSDPLFFWFLVVLGVMVGLLGCWLPIFIYLHPINPLKP